MIHNWDEMEGARLRLPFWSECYVLVVDIGKYMFIGQIYRPNGMPISDSNVFWKNDDWEFFVTLDDILEENGVQEEK